MSTKKRLPAHTKGSGNIFTDLGVPNAEEITIKPNRKRGETGRITLIRAA